MKFLRLTFLILFAATANSFAQSQDETGKESSSLQKHLDKYLDSGWSCLLNKKVYRVEAEEEARCKRLGGKFRFAKKLNRDAPSLEQLESGEAKSERMHRGY